MSVSSLPEWKQLLLERKRREEEEREKREKEEEAKLASMPVWKRGIIQRRRMKQEIKEGRSPSDLGSESPLSPDVTGPWLDEESKPQSRVLRETITPVQQNPFIRTHGGLRRGREEERAGEMGHEKGNEQEIEVGREREKEKERERGMERARSTEREVVVGRQAEPLVRDRRGSDFRRGSDARDVKRMSEVRDCTMSVETTQQNCVITLSVDRASPPQSVESHYRHVSAFTECSPTLLSTVAHRGTDWHSSQGVPGHHSTQSALSQHAGDLINKIGRVGETANELDNHKGTQTLTQDSKCPRSITINSRSLLTPSTENSLHPDQGVPPTTSSSPCSPSPPQSPSVSPSPSPSPTHFTIRTVSGGQQVKRGTTITITPRKPVGGAAVESVSVSSGPPVKTSTKAQMPVLTEVVERGKTRYPTTEEIEVIGGYQNLEKSCLVKTPKGTPKGVSVVGLMIVFGVPTRTVTIRKPLPCLPPFEPPVPRMSPPPPHHVESPFASIRTSRLIA
uniref:Phostensin/Taperin PP1-binding domain-containing protein n=1 Tax=Salmo trutta TaxID=8032 RepID=A0A674BR01_SALTR